MYRHMYIVHTIHKYIHSYIHTYINTHMPSEASVVQQQHHTRVCKGKCPSRNTSALPATLAVKSGNTKIIHQDILNALAEETNDLSMPCHEQRTGATTAVMP